MDGFLIIDKPGGITSFDVVRQVRRLCKTRKVGHAGTLDPLATGVLPVAVGQATRLLEFITEGDKVYVATLRLGAATDTQDAEGRVVATGDWQAVDRPSFDAACARMTGAIQQVPPMYSALKRDGTPLYQLARQGIEVQRSPREVKIDAIEVVRFEPPEAVLRVSCGKGTYIRTLCHDIGEHLGCHAHVTALRRARNGRFDEAESHALDELHEMAGEGRPLPLLSPAQALADWPGLTVLEGPAARLKDGVAPKVGDVSGEARPGQLVRLMVDERLAAVARCPGPEHDPEQAFELLKVFPAGI